MTVGLLVHLRGGADGARVRVVVLDPREYLRRAMLRVRRAVLGGPVEQREAVSREDPGAFVAGQWTSTPVGAEHEVRARPFDDLAEVLDQRILRDARPGGTGWDGEWDGWTVRVSSCDAPVSRGPSAFGRCVPEEWVC